jgi:GTP-binding protein EngB required for normal cell division
MNSLYYQAKFLLSAPELTLAPADIGREIAFAGRSIYQATATLKCL